MEFPDPHNIKILPFDLVELKSAPAGLMLINRVVFKTLMAKYPNKKIKFDKEHQDKMDIEIGSKGAIEENKWNLNYNKKDKKTKSEIIRIINNKLPESFNNHIADLKKNNLYENS